MISRTAIPRALRASCPCSIHLTASRKLTSLASFRPFNPSLSRLSRSSPLSNRRLASHSPPDLIRYLSSRSIADEKIEEITELFNTAQDEFEIAMEETTENTVYAEDDRKAAREEFDKLKKAFSDVVEGTDSVLAEEVKRRVGHRVRELEEAVKRMEELAMAHD